MRMALTKKWTWAMASAVLVGALMTGCAASGVGDPCVPEAIPQAGFTDRESYVETSSVQCRTRVCLVYRLAGHPERIVGTPTCGTGATNCVDEGTRDDRVFCSCRCSSAGGDSNLPLCTCNEGFHCVDLLTQGGAGVRGGYCIREGFCEDDDDCATGQTCTTGNICG